MKITFNVASAARQPVASPATLPDGTVISTEVPGFVAELTHDLHGTLKLVFTGSQVREAEGRLIEGQPVIISFGED